MGSNSFRLESTRTVPDIQQVYGISAVGSQSYLYWGEPYEPGTQFYNNVDGFFQTALTQRRNLLGHPRQGIVLRQNADNRGAGAVFRDKGGGHVGNSFLDAEAGLVAAAPRLIHEHGVLLGAARVAAREGGGAFGVHDAELRAVALDAVGRHTLYETTDHIT